MNSIQKGDFVQHIYGSQSSVRIEDEIVLPDYCEDIVRLIRVDAVPVIDKSRAYLRENTLVLEAEGRAEMCVLYTDENGGCNTWEFSRDFSHSFKKDIGNSALSPDSVTLSVQPVCVSSSPKALSKRKLLVRLEIGLLSDVFANEEYTSYNSDSHVELGSADALTEQRFVSRVLGSKTSSFTLKEDIKLPSNLPSGAKILSCTASIFTESCSPDQDAVTIFSTANINVFYLSEDSDTSSGQYVSFYQPIEMRDVMEFDDIAKDSVCRISSSAQKVKCSFSEDIFGENRILSVTLPYTLTCTAFENEERFLVSDAYGVGNDAEVSYASADFSRYVGTLSDTASFKESVILKNECSRATGVQGVAYLKAIYQNDDGWGADVALDFSFACEEDGVLTDCVKESIELRLPLTLPDNVRGSSQDDRIYCDADVCLTYIDAAVSNGTVELSGEIYTRAQVWSRNNTKFVDSVILGEKENRGGKILFYYPSADDTLWNVGKRYGVSREELKKMNSLQTDTLPEVLRIR